MKPNNAETGTLLPGDTPVTAELHAAMWKLDAVREGSLLYSTRDVQNHVRTAIEILNRPAPLPDASLVTEAETLRLALAGLVEAVEATDENTAEFARQHGAEYKHRHLAELTAAKQLLK